MARRSLWKREGLRSGYELRIRKWLDSKASIRYGYEDRRLNYIIPESKHKYTPDFSIYSTTGEFIFAVEAKGKFSSEDRKKMLAVREANPEIDLRMLFQRDQAIRKGSKTKYSDWATKHNFKFHFGEELPLEWLMEAYTL